MVRAVQDGADIRAGSDHPKMVEEVTLSSGSRASLAGDLDPAQ
jgi:hypothetical protein